PPFPGRRGRKGAHSRYHVRKSSLWARRQRSFVRQSWGRTYLEGRAMTWAIRAKRLFDGTSRPGLHDAAVVIDDGKISAVGPATQVSPPPGAEVLDAGEKTVIPGLIDAHVHILLTGSARSGEEDRAASDYQALLVGARNAYLALKSGLTTVRDCGDR